MAAYYATTTTANYYQRALCAPAHDSTFDAFLLGKELAPACADFGAAYSGVAKPGTSMQLVTKPAGAAVATARTAAQPDDRGACGTADDEKYWAFIRKNFPKEPRLYAARKTARKALKECTDDGRKADLQRAYKKAVARHNRYADKANAAYDKSVREEAREYASDSDYAPVHSEAEDDEEAEADAYYAPSDAEEAPEEEPAEDAEPAPKKSSKRKFNGPAFGPVKKAARAKRGSKPTKPLEGGCGCSCGGAHCNYATETAQICYDKSTGRRCCNACGNVQSQARNFLFGAKNPANERSTKIVCWLNQCEEVRVLGLGGGFQRKNRKAAAAVAEE
jgi:hypothetical protein